MKPIFVHADARLRRRLLALRQAAHTDKAPRVALRLQAILLSADGRTPPQIAQLLQVHRTRVHAWVCRWNEYGLEGLKEGHRRGRPRELTDTQRQQFHDIIESGPVAYGYNSGVWTSPVLARVIAEEFLLPGLSWVEIKLSAEEQNADAVVLRAPEAAGIGFDALDL